MPLKIVTGGTTGAADGTLVSSSNKITFSALDTVVDCHIRADDDTYSADATFTMPSDGAVQVSFDGGSTWKAFANNPASYGVDIGDLNVAIKLRQHANATASTGTFQTDATTPAATALGDVTGFTVTPGNAQNAVSWSAVTNRTRYQVDRATNSGFTTGVSLGVYTGTGTSFTDTGLTNGTTYYYRIKAIGTGRYKDSASYATGNGAPSSGVTIVDNFTGSSGAALVGHTIDTNPGSVAAWAPGTGLAAMVIGTGGTYAEGDASDSTGVHGARCWTPSSADVIVEGEVSLNSPTTGDVAGVTARGNADFSTYVGMVLYKDTGGVGVGVTAPNGGGTLYAAGDPAHYVSALLGSYTDATFYTLRLELTGSAVVAKLNGTTIFTGTTTNTSNGYVGIRIGPSMYPSGHRARINKFTAIG